MHTTQNILRNERRNLPQVCLYPSPRVLIMIPLLQGDTPQELCTNEQVGRSMLIQEVQCSVLPLLFKTKCHTSYTKTPFPTRNKMQLLQVSPLYTNYTQKSPFFSLFSLYSDLSASHLPSTVFKQMQCNFNISLKFPNLHTAHSSLTILFTAQHCLHYQNKSANYAARQSSDQTDLIFACLKQKGKPRKANKANKKENT